MPTTLQMIIKQSLEGLADVDVQFLGCFFGKGVTIAAGSTTNSLAPCAAAPLTTFSVISDSLTFRDSGALG